MLNGLDSWLIDRCERFSRWTQRRFGLQSDTWERWGFTIAGLYFTIKVLPRDWGTGWLPIGILVALNIAARFIGSFYHHRRTSNNPTANPDKLRERGLRRIGLVVAPLCLVPGYFPEGPWYLFLLAGMYFAACDDLPPGESKLRAVIKSLRSSLTPSPSRV